MVMNALSEMEKLAQESVNLKDECEKKGIELNRLRAEVKELKSRQQKQPQHHVIKLIHFNVSCCLIFTSLHLTRKPE
jgi:hypothetical protein